MLTHATLLRSHCGPGHANPGHLATVHSQLTADYPERAETLASHNFSNNQCIAAVMCEAPHKCYGFNVAAEYESAHYYELTGKALFGGLKEKTSAHAIPHVDMARGKGYI